MNEKKESERNENEKKIQLIPFMALELNVLATLGRPIMQFFLELVQC